MAASGKFVLRIDSKLHRDLVREAALRHISLNRLSADLLRLGLARPKEGDEEMGLLKPIVDQLQGHFGSDLLGVVLFGSRVTGKATDASDLDLLVVLDLSLPIVRSLYRWWDEGVSTPPGVVINPQFVHLPSAADQAGGLWFEVAVASIILWERRRTVTAFLEDVREFIAQDGVRRYWSNGQPYWVRTVARQAEEEGLRAE